MTAYQPKHTAIEAYTIMQDLANKENITIQQLAEQNDCKSGYEMMKHILAELNAEL